MDEPLGSMGQPVKVLVGDKPIFLCCKGCVKKIEAEPAKYVALVHGRGWRAEEQQELPEPSAGNRPAEGGQPPHVPAGQTEIRPGVFQVTPADAPFIAAQRRCPVMDEPLDAMGGPLKVHADGHAIYICCAGCAKRIAADPHKYLKILEQKGVTVPRIQ
jgi:hypothetical protein